ncbi:MAG: pantetheine-phosphate adenylyltransferase, partial [bacterium]
LLKEETSQWPNVEVDQFGGLTVEYARRRGARFIVRGLRAVSDFEFELQMALMNREIDSSVETIFLAPSTEYSFVSSSLIKEIVRLGGDVSRFVPRSVAEALNRSLKP